MAKRNIVIISHKGEGMLAKLRVYFLSGLVIFLPVALTVYLFGLTINVADGILGNFIEPFFQVKFGFYFRGISIFICLILILIIGFFVRNFLGKKLHQLFENFLLRLPFFRQVYPALKDISNFLFSHEKKSNFQQVVLVEYPRKGIYSLGFLTNESSLKIKEKLKSDLCNVFVPTVPSPLTGFVVFVPKEEIVFLDISVEQAVKFFVSCGVVNPG